MEYGLIVTVLCLLVVFGVLVFLIFALYLLQYLASGKNKSKEQPQLAEQIVREDIQVEEEDDKIIAVISAAIRMMLEEESSDKKAKFIVRSIKRI